MFISLTNAVVSIRGSDLIQLRGERRRGRESIEDYNNHERTTQFSRYHLPAPFPIAPVPCLPVTEAYLIFEFDDLFLLRIRFEYLHDKLINRLQNIRNQLVLRLLGLIRIYLERT